MSLVHAESSRRSELVSSSERRLRYSCDLSSLMRNNMAAAYVATPSLRECNKLVSGDVAPSLSIKSALSLSAANSHRTPAATRCWIWKIHYYWYPSTLEFIVGSPEYFQCRWKVVERKSGWHPVDESKFCCAYRVPRCATHRPYPRRSPPCERHRRTLQSVANHCWPSMSVAAMWKTICTNIFCGFGPGTLSTCILTRPMSCCALTSKRMRLWMAPFSRNGAWFAWHNAKLRMRPMTALIKGQRDGGFSNLTITGRP